MDEFLITLPSPPDAPSNFNTYLPQWLDLSDGYMVGLSELIYVNSIQNIPRNTYIAVRMKDGTETLCAVDSGHYDEAERLLAALNSNLPKTRPKRAAVTTGNVVEDDTQVTSQTPPKPPKQPHLPPPPVRFQPRIESRPVPVENPRVSPPTPVDNRRVPPPTPSPPPPQPRVAIPPPRLQPKIESHPEIQTVDPPRAPAPPKQSTPPPPPKPPSPSDAPQGPSKARFQPKIESHPEIQPVENPRVSTSPPRVPSPSEGPSDDSKGPSGPSDDPQGPSGPGGPGVGQGPSKARFQSKIESHPEVQPVHPPRAPTPPREPTPPPPPPPMLTPKTTVVAQPLAQPKNQRKPNTAIEFDFDETRQRVVLLVDSSLVEWVQLPEEIQRACGFADSRVTQTTVGTYHVNYSNNLDNIYVYADILQPVVFGDQRVNLLRIVPREGGFGQVVSKAFNPIHYLPVRQSSVVSIKVELRDSHDRYLNFGFGTVIAVLSFKRIRNAS